MIIGYVRTSRTYQENGRISQEQLILARYPEAKIIRDGKSGRTFDRSGIEKVRALVERGDVTMLVVTKLDRLGRNLLEAQLFIRWLEKQRVPLVALDGTCDANSLKTAYGRFVVKQVLLIAELESDIISERTLRGLDIVKARGTQLGRKVGSKNRVNRAA